MIAQTAGTATHAPSASRIGTIQTGNVTPARIIGLMIRSLVVAMGATLIVLDPIVRIVRVDGPPPTTVPTAPSAHPILPMTVFVIGVRVAGRPKAAATNAPVIGPAPIVICAITDGPRCRPAAAHVGRTGSTMGCVSNAETAGDTARPAQTIALYARPTVSGTW